MITKSNFWNFLVKCLGNERGEISLTDGGESGAPGPDGGGDPGVSDPGGDPGAQDPAGADPNADGDLPLDLPDGLDDDIKSDPSLKVFVKDGKLNYANLIKSYVHGRKQIGKDGVKVPDQYATDEDWANFYNQIREPELEKYGLKNNLPEGAVLNEELFNNYREVAHKAGLTPKQAQGVLDWYNEMSAKAVGESDKAAQEAQAQEIENLKKEWGDGLKQELGLAQRALKEFADEKTMESLKSAGLDTNVHLIRLFNKIGKGLLTEDKFEKESHGSFGMTPEQANQKINEMYADPNGAYLNDQHPNHKYAVDEMTKLIEAANR